MTSLGGKVSVMRVEPTISMKKHGGILHSANIKGGDVLRQARGDGAREITAKIAALRFGMHSALKMLAGAPDRAGDPAGGDGEQDHLVHHEDPSSIFCSAIIWRSRSYESVAAKPLTESAFSAACMTKAKDAT
jgi:hypothetical protein